MAINLLLTGLLLLFPLGQLMRLPLGWTGGGIYFHDLILVGLWLWLCFKHRQQIWLLIQKDRLSQLIIIFAGWALLTWLINYQRWGNRSLIGLGYLFRWLLLAAPYFTLKLINKKEVKKIVNLTRFSLLLTAILALMQYLIFPDQRHLIYFGWDDHYYRLTGTLIDPNFTGLILVLALGFNLIYSTPFSFAIILYLFLLYLTYSRASWLAFLGLLIAWLRTKKTIRPVLFLILGFLILIIVLPRPFGEGGNLRRTFSLKSRLHSWQIAAKIIRQNPFWGVGFNNYRLAQKELGVLGSDWAETRAGAGADNSFLFLAATAGLPGLIILLFLIWHWQPRWWIVPIIIHSLFNNSLFYPWVLLLVWLIQGSN